MTKHELDQLVFWYQEREELKSFRDSLSYCESANLLTKTTTEWSVIVKVTRTAKREHELTDIQRTKLWAFLDADIKHLDGLINGADPENREIAESVLKGNVGKVALGFKE